MDNYEPPEIRNHLDNNLNIHDDKPTFALYSSDKVSLLISFQISLDISFQIPFENPFKKLFEMSNNISNVTTSFLINVI